MGRVSAEEASGSRGTPCGVRLIRPTRVPYICLEGGSRTDFVPPNQVVDQGLRPVRGAGLHPLAALAILRDHDAVQRRKQLWRKYRRFQRPYANYLWQIDITQVPTTGPWVFIASVIDDHSRPILASRTYDKDLTQADTIQLVRQAVKQ